MATIISRDDADTMMAFAVGAAYASNEYVVDGGKGGIALNNIANGADGVIQTRCIVSNFKKAAGVAWVEGTTYLYFDQVAKAFTTVVQADGLYRGKAYKDALLAAVVGDVEIIEPISDGEGKMDLAVPTAANNVALLNALGQVTDSTVAFANVARIAVPVAAHTVAGLTAAGGLETTGILTADVVTVAVPVVAHTVAGLTAAGKLETTGILTADVQITTVPVGDHTLAALTAAGKLETSGILTADVQVTTVPVVAHTVAGLTAAGKLETSGILTADVVQTTDRRLGVITVDEACAFGAVPAAPVDGYRVLVTTTGGAYTKGKVYTFTAGAPGAYDAGVLLGNGQIVGIKSGAMGDIGLGGNAGTDLFRLSDFATMFQAAGKIAVVDIIVAMGGTTNTSAAQPTWIGCTLLSCSGYAACDQPVKDFSVDGAGVVTVTTAAATAAASTYRVAALLV